MNPLQQAIDSVLEKADPHQLRVASARLSEHYRNALSLTSEAELLAYLVVRLPATYAAICTVLRNVPKPGSILDLGAGPGTVSWAARAAWEQPYPVTAVERESTFINLGKQLGSPSQWIQGDMLSTPLKPHDWIAFGYSYGELSEKERIPLLSKCWSTVNQGIILIEPGTPRGYQNMLQARNHLISLGGFVCAPCPHSKPCPMQPPDWCHFSVRLERSFLHRLAKTATLPYEDEKYSYVIVTKTEYPTLPRIIHSPMHRSGHTILPLCTTNGLTQLTVSRRHKDLYRLARKSSWGDTFTPLDN